MKFLRVTWSVFEWSESKLKERELSQKSDEVKKKDEELERRRRGVNVATGLASTEQVNLHAEASKEYLSAYSGIDNATGERSTRSLKDISRYKVNSEKDIKAHAGYVAEKLEVARQNEDSILGKTGKRTKAYDDLSAKQQAQVQKQHPDYGAPKANHQIADVVVTDAKGDVISGSTEQLKFVGKNPKETLGKLASKDFDKYYNEPDTAIKIPKELHEGVMRECDARIDKVAKEIKHLESHGADSKVIEAKKRELEKFKTIKEKTKSSEVSTQEAIEATKNPELSTAKNVARLSHRAGIEGAKTGGIIALVVSGVKNIYACVESGKPADEAFKDVAKDTLIGAVSGYAGASTGSAIGSFMQNSSSVVVRNLAKTSFPALIVTASVGLTKSLTRYFQGEIDGVQFLEEIGEQGSGIGMSSMMALAGQMMIPIPVVGALIGGMVGYSLSTLFYQEALHTFKSAKLMREDRLRIERECEERKRELLRYREEIMQLIDDYFKDHLEFFHASIAQLEEALDIGNTDGVIGVSHALVQKLGGSMQFSNFEEFNVFMNSDEPLRL